MLDGDSVAMELNYIKANYPDTKQRCKAMFERWLLGSSATWNKLIAALEMVGLTFLADDIKKKFLFLTGK